MSAFWSLCTYCDETAAALSHGRIDGVTVPSRRADAVGAYLKFGNGRKRTLSHAHRARERELHAPPARQSRDGVRHHLLGEADLEHHLGDLVLRGAAGLDARVVEDVVDARVVRQLAQNVGFHKHRLDFICRRKPFELPIRNRPHQRRLAAVVAAEQAVLVAPLELHLRVVEEDLRAVGERERAVAELLGVVVLLLLLFHYR